MNTTAPKIPDSLYKLMAEVGPVWGSAITRHSKLMVDGFSEILVHAPKEGSVTRDIAYGAHPRHLLDVYVPKTAAGAPVVIFAHGGAFVNGAKNRNSEVYSNVCWYLARNGVVGINMEYRLAPEIKYPGAVEDVAAVVAWARKNIREFGGDPEKIVLMGHSAGAAHMGCYAYDTNFHPPEGSGIRGFITVSGRVRIETLPDNPNAPKVVAYFGDDPALMEQGSVVTHVSADSVPTMIALAQFENPLIDIHGAELFHRIAFVKRLAPRIVWLPKHNHNTAISHLNTADERLGREILAFIQEGV
jgi:acetyl esterase